MKFIIYIAILPSVANAIAEYFLRERGPLDHLLPSWDIDYSLGEGAIFMKNFGPGEESLLECKELLVGDQALPTNTLFDADKFNETCSGLAGEDSARVRKEISRLLVPSVEALAAAAKADGEASSFLDNLIETDGEQWTGMVPIGAASVRPAPEYTVGFRAEAFTASQLAKLDALGASINESYAGLSFFRATPAVYFPFLTYCIPDGAADDDDAQNNAQNISSTTSSSAWKNCIGGASAGTRAMQRLYARAGRKREAFGRVWAFTVSLMRDGVVDVEGVHRSEAFGQQGYTPALLRGYRLEAEAARARWDSYRFARNVYEVWAPRQLRRIRGLLDEIPLPDEVTLEL